MQQLVVGDSERRELMLDALLALECVVDASTPGNSAEIPCSILPTCLQIDGCSSDKLATYLLPQAKETEARIGQRAAQSVLIRVEKRPLSFEVGSCLPFVRAPQLECERLCCSESILLREGEAGTRTYLSARLACEVALELCIVGLVERGIDNDVERVLLLSRHIVDAQGREDIRRRKPFLHQFSQALLIKIAFSEEHRTPHSPRSQQESLDSFSRRSRALFTCERLTIAEGVAASHSHAVHYLPLSILIYVYARVTYVIRFHRFIRGS